MDVVEFAEKVLGLKLLYFQKKLLNKMYDIFEKEKKKMDKNKLLNGLTDIRKDLAERRGYDYSGVGYLEYVIQKIDTGAWKCDECNEKKPMSPINRAEILDAAKKCVCGQREQDYGTPESNFQLIANLWNAYLGYDGDMDGDSISAVDVAMMMSLMKIARIKNGGGTGDSFVDLAGYAACGGEINNNIKFMNYVRGWTSKEMEKVGTEVQKAIISGIDNEKNCSNCKHFSKDSKEYPCNSCSNTKMDNTTLQWEGTEAKEDTDGENN